MFVYMVYVQDINGKPMMPTTRYGKVRRLLKDKKAVVVNLCPFTIKLTYVTSDQPTNIPSGTVFCGLRHPSILSQLAAYGIAHKNRSVQGFLTSKNRFLTREEASELVRNNNQEMVVDRNAIREQLYSEDLY